MRVCLRGQAHMVLVSLIAEARAMPAYAVHA